MISLNHTGILVCFSYESLKKKQLQKIQRVKAFHVKIPNCFVQFFSDLVLSHPLVFIAVFDVIAKHHLKKHMLNTALSFTERSGQCKMTCSEVPS